MYRVTKVISAALLAFIIVTAVTVGLGSMADDGVILDAWYAMIGYIPFETCWRRYVWIFFRII